VLLNINKPQKCRLDSEKRSTRLHFTSDRE
jgi:hypothetical protein